MSDYLEKLIGECSNCPENVIVGKQAQNDANHDFKLQSVDAIKSFIFNGGLEKPIHEKSTYLEIWKDGRKPVAHSYSFYSEGKMGYLAFYVVPKTCKSFIKSFKYHFKQHEIDLAERNNPGIPFSGEG